MQSLFERKVYRYAFTNLKYDMMIIFVYVVIKVISQKSYLVEGAFHDVVIMLLVGFESEKFFRPRCDEVQYIFAHMVVLQSKK